MDPVTAFVQFATKAMELRLQLVAAMSPEKRTAWADAHAEAELEALAGWLDFVKLFRPPASGSITGMGSDKSGQNPNTSDK
jgi:hypothetical protein